MSTPQSIFRKIAGSFFIIFGILELLLPRVLNWVLGSFFVTVGIAGLILPIINGTFFLILGLILISFESHYVKKKLYALTSKTKWTLSWHMYLEKMLMKIFKHKKKHLTL